MPNRLCSWRFVDKQNRRSPFHFLVGYAALPYPPPRMQVSAFYRGVPFCQCVLERVAIALCIFRIYARSSAPLPTLLRPRRGKEGKLSRVIECILNEFLVATGRTLSNLRDVDVAVQPCAVKYLSRRDALTVTQCFRRLIKRPRTPTKSAYAAKKSGWGWSPLRAWPESDWAIYFLENARRSFEENRSFRNWIIHESQATLRAKYEFCSNLTIETLIWI